jgi:hypothetical protein
MLASPVALLLWLSHNLEGQECAWGGSEVFEVRWCSNIAAIALPSV